MTEKEGDHLLKAEALLKQANELARSGDLADFQSACMIFTDAIASIEAIKGDRHPDIADICFTFAESLVRTKHDLVGGPSPFQLHERALAIREEFCPDSIETAYSLARVGASHGVLYAGLSGDGCEYYQRAIAIAEKIGGPDHPSLVWFYVDYALSLEDGEEQDQITARHYYERAGEILKKSGEVKEQARLSIERGLAWLSRIDNRNPIVSS